MKKESNFFDDLYSPDMGSINAQNLESERKAEKLDQLIHKVFEQSEDGKELLSIWKESLIMVAGAEEGMDLIGVGIREGMKRFIRGIKNTVKRVEET